MQYLDSLLTDAADDAFSKRARRRDASLSKKNLPSEEKEQTARKD
jgi:hypothetical protein